MSLLQVFNHTTASGTIPAVLVKSARGSFERATTLPTNWKQCRIALIYSIRGLASETAAPVQESVAWTNSTLARLQIGLTNGQGMPGTAGVKFVGISRASGNPSCVSLYSGKYNIICDSINSPPGYVEAHRTDGTSTATATNSTGISNAYSATPTGTTAFAAAIVLELDVSSAVGALVIRPYSEGDISLATPGLIGPKLNQLLGAAMGTAHSLTGGWWNGTSVFSDCNTLFVRVPFANNRLVIHGYKVIQTA